MVRTRAGSPIWRRWPRRRSPPSSEDAAQLARLRELRCDLGQGFYFSRPLPADEILVFVRAGATGARPAAPTPLR
ncbi:MAG: EAL domain-containing protein [Actinobacteria bacterium]|nr:MAG: EAL domain-containing protein [Actinomycetota bacterium]